MEHGRYHPSTPAPPGVKSCLSQVSCRGTVRHYAARVPLTRDPLASQIRTFQLQVPFPDGYKNAGAVMVNSVSVRLHDCEGRQENGVFSVTSADGQQNLLAANTSPDAHAGFIGVPVSADLHLVSNMVLTVNALTNSMHLGALGRAVAGVEAFLRAPPTDRKPIQCRHCSICQSMVPREGGASFEVPTHFNVATGKNYGCRFESANRQPEDAVVNLLNKAIELTPIKNLLKKYKAAAPNAADSLASEVPIAFIAHLLTFWRAVINNSSRVFPSNVSSIGVSGRVTDVGANALSLSASVEMDLVQFHWDNPLVCAQQTTKLFSVETTMASDVLLPVEEIIRTSMVSYE